jgi:ketosteroid isomerase-like protein
MSEESTTADLEELTRRSADAFTRGDLDGAVAYFAPDAVWDLSLLGLGVYQGPEAIRSLMEEWRRSYEAIEQVLSEFRDFGNGVAFGAYAQRGRLPGSGGFIDLRYATVGTWADGLVQRATVYTDIHEARVAAERLANERE